MRKSRGVIRLSMGIILPMIALLLLLVIAGNAKGKGETITDTISDTIGDVLPLWCTSINDAGLGDPDPNSVTFDEFVASIKRVYAACDADEKMCGDKGCERMRLVLSGADCYRIDKDALMLYGLNTFVHGLFGSSAYIGCCETTSFVGGITSKWQELDYYNPRRSCTPEDGTRCSRGVFFSVADGSYVEVSARRNGGIIFFSTDVIVKANDGRAVDYTTCVPL